MRPGLSKAWGKNRRSRAPAAAAVGAGRAGGDLGVVGIGVLLLGDWVEAARGRATEAQPLQPHDVEGFRRGRLVGSEVDYFVGSRGGGHGSATGGVSSLLSSDRALDCLPCLWTVEIGRASCRERVSTVV